MIFFFGAVQIAAGLDVEQNGTGEQWCRLYLELLIIYWVFTIRNYGQSLCGTDSALNSSQLFPAASRDPFR